MWPFREKHSINELWERFERLQRDFLALQEEWDDAFDRIRRAENRIKEKRARLEANGTTTGEQGTPDLPPGALATNDPLHRLLSPRQLQIQAEIMKRRGGVQ